MPGVSSLGGVCGRGLCELGRVGGVDFMWVRRVGLSLSRDAASCGQSLGQQGGAVGPLQGGRAPGIFNRIGKGRGRGSGGLSGQGIGAGRAVLASSSRRSSRGRSRGCLCR